MPFCLNVVEAGSRCMFECFSYVNVYVCLYIHIYMSLMAFDNINS